MIKLSTLLLVLAFNSYAQDTESWLSGDDYSDFYSHVSNRSWDSEQLPSPQNFVNLRELKLVKTDFSKYIGRLQNWKSFVSVPSETCLLIETLISAHIQTTLVWVNSQLQAKDPLDSILMRSEIEERIKPSIVELFRSVDCLIPSFIHRPEDEESDQEDDPENKALQSFASKSLFFALALDLYYRDQLLWMSYGLLQPINPKKLDSYSQKTEFLRLQNYSLYDGTPIQDSLITLKSKQAFLFLINQIVRTSLQKIDDTGLLKLITSFPFEIEYTLNTQNLVRFYESCSQFLADEFNRSIKEDTSPAQVHETAQTFLEYMLNMYADFGSYFPDLMRIEQVRHSIKSCFLNNILNLHLGFFEAYSEAVVGTIDPSISAQDLQEQANLILRNASQIHTVIRSKTAGVSSPFKQNPTDLFERSIYTCFLAILNHIEQVYANRSFLTKTVTAWGGRTSQTSQLLTTLKTDYMHVYPFLFTTDNDMGASILQKFEQIDAKMKAIDEHPVEITKKTAKAYWESASTRLNSWWTGGQK